jgi:hypothetical protein
LRDCKSLLDPNYLGFRQSRTIPLPAPRRQSTAG